MHKWDKARAWKRGGRHCILSLEDETVEARFQEEPSGDLHPDQAFEQAWALSLFQRVLAQLRDEYAADGKAGLHAALHP